MPTLVMAYRLNKVAHGADYVRLQFGTFEQIVPRHRWLDFALERVSFATWQPIAAINIPGTAVEILISLPLSWPYLWKPNELSFYAWRTLTLPFFCLPAWWLVGRGLDGLVRRIHLHWVVLLIGSALSGLCLFFLVGLCLGTSAQDRVGSGWALWGLGFWSLGFGVLPLAWQRQKLAKRERHDAFSNSTVPCSPRWLTLFGPDGWQLGRRDH